MSDKIFTIKQIQNILFPILGVRKNNRAISFYQGHGFYLTGQKKFEEDTTEYLVKLEIGK